MLKSVINKMFGTVNDKQVKKYLKKVTEINKLEDKYKKLNDLKLKESFSTLVRKVKRGEISLDSALNDSFAITREVSSRVLGMRHFDVQLIGGIVLHEGNVAEMKTGEGKTLVSTLAAVLNTMVGTVHIVTVNDYLVSRDSKEMSPLYNFLGLKVGVLLEVNSQNAEAKSKAYSSDITYGTNNSFGFDYLRDNMSYSSEHIFQKSHNFVIIDEVDSILIDEARTPLVISGPTNNNPQDHMKANLISLKLNKDIDFIVDEKEKIVLLTEDGIKSAEELFNVDNLFSKENASLSHLLDLALKANFIFIKDIDYVVNNKEVVIVDEFTGRLSEGRRFSEGLHQAIEAKEGVKIKEETQTLADITYQNYFRMYDKLSGMTGTAATEATEFNEIYSLDVISIPTNIPIKREDLNDLIYKTEEEKFYAVLEKIKELSISGQPVLIGTASIEKSELLHKFLSQERIKHTVLNAKNHKQEGEIIKQAGLKGSVTIATNMAGRGVDIKVNDEVKNIGGLYIIGTERHENRRIDNQLRGRSGRQGDPGITQFYLSLEDSLLRIFGSDKIKGMMERLGVENGEYIESKMVTRAVEKAQIKVESLHYEGRKRVIEYDDVANQQRKIVYKFRSQLLDPKFNLSEKIESIRNEYVSHILNISDIFKGGDSEDFNLIKLQELLKEELNFYLDLKLIKNFDYEEIELKLITLLTNDYNAKMLPLGEVATSLERDFYLKELDKTWRHHLYSMDVMKEGIQLRAYNQKDPLTEYKKESFNLFSEFINDLKFNTIKVLHIIQFNIQIKEQ